jgi:hypothetical protein
MNARAIILACLILGGCDDMFRRGDLPERPPEQYRDLPLPRGWTERQFPTLAEVKAYCAEMGGQFTQRSEVGGCTVYPRAEIVIPAIGRAVDAKRQGGAREHETAHAYDLRHPDNYRGWVNAQGQPVPKLSPDQIAAFRSAAIASAGAPPNRMFGAR